MCDRYHCAYLPHITFRFDLINYQLNTDFPTCTQFCIFHRKITYRYTKIGFLIKKLLFKRAKPISFSSQNCRLLFFYFTLNPGLATYAMWATCDPRAILVRPARHAEGKIWGALPYVGRYYLPVNSHLDPFFDTNLAPNDPVFHYSPHPNTFFSELEGKIFHTLSAHFISKHFGKFPANNGKFSLKFAHIHTKFWEIYTKKGLIFGIPQPMIPFLQNPTPSAPLCFVLQNQ